MQYYSASSSSSYIILNSKISVVLVVVYLIHGEIVVNEFDNLTSGILTIVAVVFLLINLIMSIVYLRD